MDCIVHRSGIPFRYKAVKKGTTYELYKYNDKLELADDWELAFAHEQARTLEDGGITSAGDAVAQRADSDTEIPEDNQEVSYSLAGEGGRILSLIRVKPFNEHDPRRFKGTIVFRDEKQIAELASLGRRSGYAAYRSLFTAWDEEGRCLFHLDGSPINYFDATLIRTEGSEKVDRI